METDLSCRVELPGIEREPGTISFEFTCESKSSAGATETHRVEARRGETIAAALIGAGHWEMRKSHLQAGAKRAGATCGMGVCSECIVLVNGVRRRACMEPAAAGLSVKQHPSHAQIGAPAPHPTELTLQPDVLIVGAGPAGLSAACAAAGAGLDVLVVDERRAPGGQFFKQPNEGFHIDPWRVDAQFRAGRELIDAAEQSGARFSFQTSVWGAFRPTEIRATTPTHNLRIRPRRLILACGAYEASVPFQGWDLPGVLTTGAAQTLLRGSLVIPGRRVLIAGNGPLNLQVARELADAGAQIAAVAEAAESPGISSLGALARMGMTSPRLLMSGVEHVLALRRHGVKVCYRHALTRVAPHASDGDKRELIATLSVIDENGHPVRGTEQHHVVDAVCTGYGFQAQSEIARALGCTHSYDARRGGLVVNRDVECRTNVVEVFVAGDGGGLGGAHVAMAQGTLAGVAAARDLGKAATSAVARRASAARKQLARHLRFQSALWSLYAAPLLLQGQLAGPDTQICRCEGLTKGELLAFVDQGMSLAAIKRCSRAAMGGCQGRYCTSVMAEIRRLRTGGSFTEADMLAPRPPFRPTVIAGLSLQQEG
jgi:NADPH-dependent 2,4-dienoyl-CoA reductase/sulfur reductase-like enzyme